MALTVVVVAYGAPDVLVGALRTLGPTYPVVVVDNSSSSVTRDLAARHGAMYLDPGANVGFAVAVNRAMAGLTDADGDVLLLNPDARVTGAELERLHARLRARSDLAGVAPALHAEGSTRPVQAHWPWHTPAGAWAEAIGLGRRRQRSGRYFLGGAVLLLRREAIVDVGPLDERFFLYSEDEDWQRRAIGRGWRVDYCPEIHAEHIAGGTEHDPVRLQLRLHAGIERYVRKWYGVPGWALYRAGTVFGFCLRAVTRTGPRRDTARRLAQLYRTGPDRAARRAGAVPAPPA